MRVIGDRDALAVQRALLTANPSAPDVFKGVRAYKYFAASEIKAIDPKSRQIAWKISTATQDRMGDTIEVDGWELEAFKKNPVVLYGHDYRSLPIARAITIEKSDGALRSVSEFATKEQYPFADTVYQLILGKFLNTTSVGFDPLKWVFNEETHGIDFKEQGLLEYSVVPVPANPEALVEARAAGIDLAPMREWVERSMDIFHPDAWLLLPSKAHLEQARKVLADAKLISIPAAAGKTIVAVGEQVPEAVIPLLTKGQMDELIRTHLAEQIAIGAFDDAMKRLYPAPPAGGLGLELTEEEMEPGSEIVLELAADEPELEPALTAADVRDVLGNVIGDAVRAEFNRLKGRVD